jgi:diaminopimelate epimerase
MTGLTFKKMHGLGNDFVIIDARNEPVTLSDATVRAIADRRTGVGCDQLIVLEPPRNGGGDIRMRIRNADGVEVDACGNGARCVGAIVLGETGRASAIIETAAGPITADEATGGQVSVDMGPARIDWQDIPLAEQVETLHLDISEGPLHDPAAVGMGNPHVVFFVENVDAIDLDRHGPVLEHHPLFPERTNVEIVQVLARDRLRVRVWERGVGITEACGTGACASAVAAARRDLAERTVTVELEGGPLQISWLENGHVRMTGPVAHSFDGVLDAALLS